MFPWYHAPKSKLEEAELNPEEAEFRQAIQRLPAQIEALGEEIRELTRAIRYVCVEFVYQWGMRFCWDGLTWICRSIGLERGGGEVEEVEVEL